MNRLNRGDIVELDGLLAVVVGVEGDPLIDAEGDLSVPEEHVAVWFGDPRCTRTSQGGTAGMRPEIWTVPSQYFTPAASPIFKH